MVPNWEIIVSWTSVAIANRCMKYTLIFVLKGKICVKKYEFLHHSSFLEIWKVWIQYCNIIFTSSTAFIRSLPNGLRWSRSFCRKTIIAKIKSTSSSLAQEKCLILKRLSVWVTHWDLRKVVKGVLSKKLSYYSW